ncbi:MAG: sulfate ABC transporter permease subunit CysT [Leptospiraceae bacterium]|nr:sulfate ABC transporter permease subunit CysT [Leptospiraceae bacterium]
MKNKRQMTLPGFKRTLTYTLIYLGLIVILPLTVLIYKGTELGVSGFTKILNDERVLASLWISFSASLLATIVNTFFGLILAWSIVRYEFFGKNLLNTLIDLPLTLPTAVAGISLTAIYSEKGFIGSKLSEFGIKSAYNFNGIVIALIFIGIPYIVRTIQPVIEELQKEDEEASESLGASNFQTFWYVIFPVILPSLFTGFGLAFSRALGEYGSVIFISGNLPYQTEIIPLVIITKLEQYQYNEATAIATIMLFFSFTILILLNLIQKRFMRQ